MKLLTANKLNRFFSGIKTTFLDKKIDKTRVLTTVEEVEANTNPENVASALVTGELINNLGDCHIVTEGSGADTEYYIQKGADSASKKRLGKTKLRGGYRLSTTYYGNTTSSLSFSDIKGTVLTVSTSGITRMQNVSDTSRFIVRIDGVVKLSTQSAGTHTFDISQASSVMFSVEPPNSGNTAVAYGSYSIE